MRPLKIAVAAITVALALVGSAGPALADAAGPTDYQTYVVAVEPATESFQVDIIGGDSFVRLRQLEPVEIVVLGYQTEQYLRFDADGTVVENRRSPTTWLNEQRYGTDEIPEFANAEAPPDWQRVADDGLYAWHDHRSHWMEEVRPFGAEPGDQVLEAGISLLVDGLPVTIIVESYLLQGPSIWPSVLGVLAGVGLATVGWRGSRRVIAAIGAGIGAAATAMGSIAFGSVPPETEPELLLWLLPVAALVLFGFVALAAKSMATTVFLDGALAAGGALLGYWFWTRSSALTAALIPSDAPAWLDRTIIAATAVVAVVTIGRGVLGLMNPQALHTP